MEGKTRTLTAAQRPPRRAIASMVGTWPDQVQDCGPSQLSPWFRLKPACVRVTFPASHLLGLVHLLWVEMEHPEPSEAELEGEGTALWEGHLG